MSNGPVPQSEKLGDGRFEPIRAIRVRGAREHNLRSVDVDIPRDRMIVVTGLSGSGKSSLAFDTIFAEGQRKYMESLSAYARQFLDQLKKPDIDSIEGLPPTIAIEQRQASHNPRSTVATSTEIYDYLRLLYARRGEPTCWHRDKPNGPRCGRPIQSTNPSELAAAISQMPEGTRLMVLAPVIRSRKGYHRETLETLAKAGFARARVNGDLVDLATVLADANDNPLNLGRYEKHDIEAVVDRIVVREGARRRLADSFETGLKAGAGAVIISTQNEDRTWSDTLYSDKYACAIHPDCAIDELEPRIFSFNSPEGACPACHGLGSLVEFDDDLLIPDPERPLGKGGVAALSKAGPTSAWGSRFLKGFAAIFDADVEAPIAELSDKAYHALLHGGSNDEGQAFAGIVPTLKDWFEKTDSDNVKEHLAQYMTEQKCPECTGSRLHIRSLSVWMPLDGDIVPESLAEARAGYGLDGRRDRVHIAELATMNIRTAREVLERISTTEESERIVGPIVREVLARLGFLESVGLDYLSLDRRTGTLSGGEAQRIRLATQVGSGIVGAAYVLDEPSIGLHARDNDRLIATLRHLTDIGNTVVVVEHDEEMIRSADHVLDMGPGPGVHGGRVVAQGQIADLEAAPESVTGAYLSGRRSIATPPANSRRKLGRAKKLKVLGASENNLKGVDVSIPLGGLVCVTGVSGSGKSTLVNDIVLRAVKRTLYRARDRPGAHRRIDGLKHIQRIVEVDQSPIGRTPRSNPATYTGMFDGIRSLFARTPEARSRGYGPGRFSFNVRGGRCEQCQGQGVKKVEMHFLPDVFVTCEACRGLRYNRETLEITYRGKSIADVLKMTIEDACEFFSAHRKLKAMTQCLYDVGLGYIELGQPSTTLSGGEAQRVKLATELGRTHFKRGIDHSLYVLDEPTTGLHFEDVRKLTEVLERLVEQGDSVLVIEHNLDVIKRADWIIDLGPEGGDGGGQIVAQGPPEKIVKTEGSLTGQYLAPLLQ